MRRNVLGCERDEGSDSLVRTIAHPVACAPWRIRVNTISPGSMGQTIGQHSAAVRTALENRPSRRGRLDTVVPCF
jgi:NAD(P)-dependent dehydrogenase (short-subunit alcohol dehydrogenase family)